MKIIKHYRVFQNESGRAPPFYITFRQLNRWRQISPNFMLEANARNWAKKQKIASEK